MIRFGWKTLKVDWGAELTLNDTEMHITDKDDVVHIKTVPADWDAYYGGNPYVINSLSRARCVLNNHEYIKTDADLYIPRCNIKSVKFKALDDYYLQPLVELRGIPNWTPWEWFTLTAAGATALVILLATATVIYKFKY